MLRGYDFVSEEMVAYFRRRLDQAPATPASPSPTSASTPPTPEKRAAVARALLFKCDVLWAQLDALHHAYVLGGGVPPAPSCPTT
jgi:pyrroloquinoline-quinone synthase